MLSSDAEHTLTSEFSSLGQRSERLLALTILWHPDLDRVGEQFVAAPEATEIALHRFAPAFCRPAAPLRALEERCIAREPVLLRRNLSDGLTISLPPSRMRVALDGVPVSAPVSVSAERIGAGLVLELGGAVLLCVHWLDGLPRVSDGSALIGVSSSMRKACEAIRQVAATELPVLLLGETGTGKELAARAIHAASRHSDGPLVTVNMAALNDALAAAELFGAAKGAYTGAERERSGFFSEAAGGTLFLDEIGNAQPAVQPMLLRVLDSGEYRSLGASRPTQSRARLIAATDQPLGADSFNQPLLRRLEGFVIRMPALRERREDIGLLVLHAMRGWKEGTGSPLTLPASLVGEMCSHDWPGNVRQLGNVVRRALLALQGGQAPTLAELVPAAARPSAQTDRADGTRAPAAPLRRADLSRIDPDDVIAAMETSGWQIRGAAETLGVSRPSMYKLLDLHPQIRAASAIPLDELRGALARHGNDIARCAITLKTPSEALRRHLRGEGLID